MTAIVLPDVDRSTIDELRKKMPDLKEIELPSLELPRFEKLGRSADQQVDRIRGRRSAWSGAWPWIAAGIGLVAIVGAIAALMSWNRRSTWSSTTTDPWTEDALGSMATSGMPGTTGGVTEITEISGTTTDLGTDTSDVGSGLGLTAAEASLMSNDPSEDRGL